MKTQTLFGNPGSSQSYSPTPIESSMLPTSAHIYSRLRHDLGFRSSFPLVLRLLTHALADIWPGFGLQIHERVHLQGSGRVSCAPPESTGWYGISIRFRLPLDLFLSAHRMTKSTHPMITPVPVVFINHRGNKYHSKAVIDKETVCSIPAL